MKPYFAIMVDSFWDAVTNKILWGLLVCWTLLLGGLAPFGYVTEASSRFTQGDIIYGGLVQKLAKALLPDGNEKHRAIATRLSPSFKAKLNEANAEKEEKDRNAKLQKIRERDVIAELNKLLDDKDLFDPKLFESIAVADSLKPIVDKERDKRTKLEVEQLNRTLISRTFSANLKGARLEAIWMGYAGIKLGNQIPLRRSEINVFVESFALQIIIRLGLSFVVVFVGLIITSPMIPETFRSGSLHLLLSKPVSRPLIYLTKFFGGMMFVLINIAYLLVGLYLLVGWRLGIWNVGLIWCIPLLLFAFVIFYSVSALIGLVWNNPILCVIVCIVFWIFCLTLGVIEGGMRMPAVWMPQILRFAQVGDDLLVITQDSEVKVWNEKYQVWQPAADINSQGPGRVLGPLYDEEHKRLYMRADFSNGLGGMETRNRNFVVVDLNQDASHDEPAKPEEAPPAAAEAEKKEKPNEADEETADGTIPQNAEEARRKARWETEAGPEPPILMIDLVLLGKKKIAVTRNGFFEFDTNAVEVADATKNAPNIFGDLSGWLKRIQPQTFRDLTPADYAFGESVRVTTTPDGQSLIVYNSDTIDSLKLDEKGKFVVEHSLKIGEEANVSALIAASNNSIVVGRENKPLVVLDRQLTKTIAEIPTLDKVDPRQLLVIGETDRFSIVDHKNRLLIVDPASKSLTKASIPHQGAITGLTWMSNEEAWVGVRPNTAMRWNVQTSNVSKTLTPQPSRLDVFYNWIARPLYVISPKPSSLNGVLSKLLSRERAEKTQVMNNDISAFRVEIEVWQPIISNLIFVAVLLTIGCIYVKRKEW